MWRQNPVSKEIAHLKHDAARMMRDISKLGEAVTETGRERTVSAANKLSSRIESQIGPMTRSLREVGAEARCKLENIDGTIRSRPYAFLAGAFGLGMACGLATLLGTKR